MNKLTSSVKTLAIPGMLLLGACCTVQPVPVKPAPTPAPVVVPKPVVVPTPVVVPKPVVVAPAPAPVVVPPPVPVVVPKPVVVAKPVVVVPPSYNDIFFDFDKADIRNSETVQLDKIADWMKANPNKTIAIEAHSDIKGSNAYNIALGQRRANAAKEYFVKQHGVDASRIKAVSYGKEKPFVGDTGDQSLNRRVHVVLE